MLLSYYLSGQDGGLSQGAINDVMNSSTVQSFAQLAVAMASLYYTCGGSGSYSPPSQYYPQFNPANSLGWGDVHFYDWVLTGNWQLLIGASCKWKCDACAANSRKCNCSVQCNVMGNISKTYTLLYLGSGSNPVNICTTGLLNILHDGSYSISQNFSLPLSGTGSAKCCK